MKLKIEYSILKHVPLPKIIEILEHIEARYSVVYAKADGRSTQSDEVINFATEAVIDINYNDLQYFLSMLSREKRISSGKELLLSVSEEP